MTNKLNIKYIYRSNGCKLDPNMYYLHSDSYRNRCNRCRFNLFCPYSYMGIYYNEEGNCIKCLRFRPYDEYSYKYVNLYTTIEAIRLYQNFEDGKVT